MYTPKMAALPATGGAILGIITGQDIIVFGASLIIAGLLVHSFSKLIYNEIRLRKNKKDKSD